MVGLIYASASGKLISAHAAEICTEQDFAAVMDRTGARLNKLTRTNRTLVNQKLKVLNSSASGRPATEGSLQLTRQQNARLQNLNTHIDELISRMDRLGDLTLDPTTDCRRLKDLKVTAARLEQVMNQRFDLIDRAIDARLTAQHEIASRPPGNKNPPKRTEQQKPSNWTTTTTANQKTNRKTDWSTTTSLSRLSTLPRPSVPAEDTFSIEEIQAAGRGFFGTISTNLANVINFAFQKVGKPTGYILGREGGGAFVLGLRYGQGRLIMKRHKPVKVYWRGPSFGYDAGAEGSRTMYLIYNLPRPGRLYRRFSGVDGAAYFVGGVGITFLTDRKVVLAPIRSGLGFRLGASVGYLKFSPKPGWNPF